MVCQQPRNLYSATPQIIDWTFQLQFASKEDVKTFKKKILQGGPAYNFWFFFGVIFCPSGGSLCEALSVMCFSLKWDQQGVDTENTMGKAAGVF